MLLVVSRAVTAAAMGEIRLAQLDLQEDRSALPIRQAPPEDDINRRCGLIADRPVSVYLAQKGSWRHPLEADLINGEPSPDGLTHSLR